VDALNAVHMDISQMNQNAKNLPVQELDDKSIGVD
jgi:hypothetical protein